MISDIVLQAKKLIFWFCSDPNTFSVHKNEWLTANFNSERSWRQQNLDQKYPESEPYKENGQLRSRGRNWEVLKALLRSRSRSHWNLAGSTSPATLSGVTSEWCPYPWLCARDHTSKVAAGTSRWQRVGDLIG